MPHLPPVELIGGSVTINLPVNEVDAEGEVLQCLFGKGNPEIKPYPAEEDKLDRKEPDNKTYPKEAKRYTIQSYSTLEQANAQIYLVEIYGADESEMFEFRPKEGKCSVKVYYALADEKDKVQKLMDARRWPNTVKELEAEGV